MSIYQKIQNLFAEKQKIQKEIMIIQKSCKHNNQVIKSIKENESVEKSKGMIHKGIAKRYFSKAFTIADDVEITGAELKDGLLKVSLNKILPEGKKPRKIEVK